MSARSYIRFIGMKSYLIMFGTSIGPKVTASLFCPSTCIVLTFGRQHNRPADAPPRTGQPRAFGRAEGQKRAAAGLSPAAMFTMAMSARLPGAGVATTATGWQCISTMGERRDGFGHDWVKVLFHQHFVIEIGKAGHVGFGHSV